MGDFWKLRSGKRSSSSFDDYESYDEYDGTLRQENDDFKVSIFIFND